MHENERLVSIKYFSMLYFRTSNVSCRKYASSNARRTTMPNEAQEQKNDNQIAMAQESKTPYFGDIFAKEGYSIHLYSSPLKNLPVLNLLLASFDRHTFTSNIWSAINSGELQFELVPKLKEILSCSKEWEYFPLTAEDINPQLQAFLRWLIMTYGGTKVWKEFSEQQMKHVEDLLAIIKRGNIAKSTKGYLTVNDYELQFYVDMLHENMALDCVGGSFQISAEGHPLIVRRNTGVSNFSVGNKSKIRISPTKLLMWLEHTLREWRRAIKKERPEIMMPTHYHRDYHPVDTAPPSSQEEEDPKNHAPGIANDALYKEIEEFSKLIKKLRTPPPKTAIVTTPPIGKKSSLKTTKSIKVTKITTVTKAPEAPEGPEAESPVSPNLPHLFLILDLLIIDRRKNLFPQGTSNLLLAQR